MTGNGEEAVGFGTVIGGLAGFALLFSAFGWWILAVPLWFLFGCTALLWAIGQQ